MFGGIWVDGSFVFTMLVIIANVKILISSFLITWPIVFLVVASTVFFFIVFWGVSTLDPASDSFGNLQNLVTFPQTYLFLFFFCSGYILIDVGLHYLRIELEAWYQRRLSRHLLEEKLKKAKDTTTIRRKVTIFKSKYCL